MSARIKRQRRPNTFVFQMQKYRYFAHPYNNTKENERSVEIPIILTEVKRAKRKSILEVGNVLSHYIPIHHDVVDKYEKGPGVINKDILLYTPKKTYDLIVSISTLEHVGWDEFPRDSDKIPKVLLHLQRLLADGGKIMFTVPVAINDYLDALIHEHMLPVTHLFCLKRMTQSNTWEEKSWEQIRYCLYDTPFPNANGIVVGILEKSDTRWEKQYRSFRERILHFFDSTS